LVELLIIADDLTGAIETGVQLAKQRIPSKVALNSEIDLQSVFAEIDCSVFIVNTESRHLPLKEAAARVTNVLKKAQLAKVSKYYKKTDSTMRGNIGAELEAFLHESSQQTLAFIPAHPALGRYTRKGFHYIYEKLLHETEFAKDPLEPINQSSISEILHLKTSINVRSIDPARKDNKPLEEGMMVFDCRSEHDLRAIGDILLSKGLHHAIAGSAAMVQLLPQLHHLNILNLKTSKLHGPSLVINGSLNRISLEQVRYAGEKGIKTISIPQELLIDSNFHISQYFISLHSEIKTTILNGQDIILNSTPIDDAFDFNFSTKELLKQNRYELIAERIGLIVAAILEEVHLSILTVFGGDTISGIMQAMSCDYIEPEQEIIPGVALSLVTVKNKNLHLVSKPGGYGDKDAIIQILDFIKTSKL
jgi:uncharacterized protein YgbK (DUF1537 family)